MIQNNISAMNTHRNLLNANSGLSSSLEKLSSGYRINKAADDAAGLSISQTFRATIASDTVAARNTSEASSMLQVAEGGTEQIGNILTRLKELATQAASDNVSDDDRDKIDAEATQLTDEITRISDSTTYGDTKLLDGTFSGKTFQVGASNTGVNQITVGISGASASDLLGSSGIDLSTNTGAQGALDSIDTAISDLNTTRGNIGAYMNRLSYASANLSSTIENTTAAESTIRDVDMAAEMTTFTKNQILMQAGTAMLAQANQAPQTILSLLK